MPELIASTVKEVFTGFPEQANGGLTSQRLKSTPLRTDELGEKTRQVLSAFFNVGGKMAVLIVKWHRHGAKLRQRSGATPAEV